MGAGDLDEVAQQIVVADLERADPGLALVALLERGDVAAALVAQHAQLVEFRRPARPHEAAVACEQRRILIKAQSEAVDQAVQRHEALGDRPQRLLVADDLAQAVSRRQPVGDRQQITGSTTCEGQTAERPLQIGAAAQLAAQLLATLRGGDQALHLVEPLADRLCLRKGCCQPLGQQPGAGVGDRSVDRGQQRAVAPASQAGMKLQIPPRCRIDQQDTVRLQAPRSVQPGQQSLLSELQIAQKGACRGKLRPPELAQAIHGGDAELAAQPSLGGDAVEVSVGERSHGHAHLAARRVHLGSQSVGQQQLAGPQARQH